MTTLFQRVDKRRHPFILWLLAAAAVVATVIVTTAAEYKDYKNDNPETIVVTEATVVSKATHTLHLLFKYAVTFNYVSRSSNRLYCGCSRRLNRNSRK